MIPPIFTTFLNLQELDIRKIRRNGQQSLKFLTIMDDSIEEIEGNAFAGLEWLGVLILIRNKISEIAPGTHVLFGLARQFVDTY